MSLGDLEGFDTFTADEAVAILEERIAAGSSGSKAWNQYVLLSLLHQRGVRRPAVVVKHGKQLIEAWKGRTNMPELWQVYEWVGIAALDTYDPFANECKNALKKRFGDSSLRVRRFIALDLENAEEWAQAAAMYDKLVELDPTQPGPRKRKAVMLREQGRIADAVREMCEYVELFSEDQSAWVQLFEMYMWLGEWRLAQFAAEELVLIKPENYLYHIMVADAAYSAYAQASRDESKGSSSSTSNTSGSGEINAETLLRTARAHYAQSLKLKRDNRRAAYGLAQVCRNMTFAMNFLRV